MNIFTFIKLCQATIDVITTEIHAHTYTHITVPYRNSSGHDSTKSKFRRSYYRIVIIPPVIIPCSHNSTQSHAASIIPLKFVGYITYCMFTYIIINTHFYYGPICSFPLLIIVFSYMLFSSSVVAKILRKVHKL